jgi:hypothetical protein
VGPEFHTGWAFVLPIINMNNNNGANSFFALILLTLLISEVIDVAMSGYLG